jgi:hypothetical protein
LKRKCLFPFLCFTKFAFSIQAWKNFHFSENHTNLSGLKWRENNNFLLLLPESAYVLHNFAQTWAWTNIFAKICQHLMSSNKNGPVVSLYADNFRRAIWSTQNR